MPDPTSKLGLRRPRVVEGMLLLGYVLLLAAAVVTVVIPELSKEPESTNGAPLASPIATPVAESSTK